MMITKDETSPREMQENFFYALKFLISVEAKDLSENFYLFLIIKWEYMYLTG